MQKIIDAINVKKNAGNTLVDVTVEYVITSKNAQEVILFDFACKYTNQDGELIDHQTLTLEEVTNHLKDALINSLE